MGDFYMTTPIPPFADSIGAAFNTFTTKKDVSPFPLPIVNGYQLRPGTRIKVEADGEFSTTGTPTLQIGLYIGTEAGTITTDLALSSAITTGSGAASWGWRLEWRGLVTAVGVAGSVTGMGNLELGTSLTASTTFPIPITLALRTVAWDTTLARAIGIAAAWSASSASNSIKTYSISALLQN